jgi:effector-binding domain-containing protein
MDIVYAFLKATGTPHLGINVAVYHGSDPPGLVMEAGVRVPTAFTGDSRVSCTRTPAGPALTVTHRGPYHLMPRAYEALRAWARTNGREPGTLSWEVYGHWTENPADLQTDIWWLLR